MVPRGRYEKHHSVLKTVDGKYRKAGSQGVVKSFEE
jgi:hypothetical protein